MRALGGLAVCLAAAACAPGAPETIEREVFVETYVALRAAELRSPEAVIPDGERERVLAEMGVSEDDLRTFAEAHGGDVAFMEAVWVDVQSRIAEAGSQPDGPGQGAIPPGG